MPARASGPGELHRSECALLRQRSADPAQQSRAQSDHCASVAFHMRERATREPLAEVRQSSPLLGDARGGVLEAPREIVDTLHVALKLSDDGGSHAEEQIADRAI